MKVGWGGDKESVSETMVLESENEERVGNETMERIKCDIWCVVERSGGGLRGGGMG